MCDARTPAPKVRSERESKREKESERVSVCVYVCEREKERKRERERERVCECKCARDRVSETSNPYSGSIGTSATAFHSKPGMDRPGRTTLDY